MDESTRLAPAPPDIDKLVRFSDYKDANQPDNLICYCKTCRAIQDHGLNGKS